MAEGIDHLMWFEFVFKLVRRQSKNLQAEMSVPCGIDLCRHFSPEIEALAAVWSNQAMGNNPWRETGRAWGGTDSQPFEVASDNNVRGVAKPGALIADGCLRAVHEKIVSDLAYQLGLPIPPVALWDRGEETIGDRYCAVSAVAFKEFYEWRVCRPFLSATQRRLAQECAGAMRVFDTWVAATDRRDDHILMEDNGDENTLALAHIDYALALSNEWGIGPHRPANDPRPAHPDGFGYAPAATEEAVKAIENIDKSMIEEIVKRIPAAYFKDDARNVILSTLLMRRGAIRSLMG